MQARSSTDAAPALKIRWPLPFSRAIVDEEPEQASELVNYSDSHTAHR